MKQYSEKAQQIFNRDDVTVIGFDTSNGHYYQIGEGAGSPKVAISSSVYWELVEMGEEASEPTDEERAAARLEADREQWAACAADSWMTPQNVEDWPSAAADTDWGADWDQWVDNTVTY